MPATRPIPGTGVEKVDQWLGSEHWDVIHFNWGLHDLKHLKDGKLDLAGERRFHPRSVQEESGGTRQATGEDWSGCLFGLAPSPIPKGAAWSNQWAGDRVQRCGCGDHGLPQDRGR